MTRKTSGDTGDTPPADLTETNADAEAPVSFEQALDDLETVVEQLEGGDLSLEASLDLYERGMRLGDHCQKALDAAEQKVRILTERAGEARLEPFPAGDES